MFSLLCPHDLYSTSLLYLFYKISPSLIIIFSNFELYFHYYHFLQYERNIVLEFQAESLLLRNLPERAARIFAESDRDFDLVVLRLLGIISFRSPSSFSFSSSFSFNFLVDGDNNNGNKNNDKFKNLNNKNDRDNNLGGFGLKSLSEMNLLEVSPLTSAALLIYLESRLEVLGGTRAFDPSIANKVSGDLKEFHLMNKLPYMYT